MNFSKIKKYSPKKRTKKRVRTILKQYRTKAGVKVETEPEKLMKNILRSLGINFTQEYPITLGNHYRVYDFYCYSQDEYSFLIECDGDFFHAREYYIENKSLSKLHKIQRKNIRNDKLKNKIAQSLGLPLLRFWENDIKNNSETIITTIQAELKKQSIT